MLGFVVHRPPRRRRPLRSRQHPEPTQFRLRSPSRTGWRTRRHRPLRHESRPRSPGLRRPGRRSAARKTAQTRDSAARKPRPPGSRLPGRPRTVPGPSGPCGSDPGATLGAAEPAGRLGQRSRRSSCCTWEPGAPKMRAPARELFQDAAFPASNSSIFSSFSTPLAQFREDITWRRPQVGRPTRFPVSLQTVFSAGAAGEAAGAAECEHAEALRVRCYRPVPGVLEPELGAPTGGAQRAGRGNGPGPAPPPPAGLGAGADLPSGLRDSSVCCLPLPSGAFLSCSSGRAGLSPQAQSRFALQLPLLHRVPSRLQM